MSRARPLRRRRDGVGTASDAAGPAPSSSPAQDHPRFDPTIVTRRFVPASGGLPTLVEMSSSSAHRARAPARPEIQALRAVAIGCVVLHHFWPAVAPGGLRRRRRVLRRLGLPDHRAAAARRRAVRARAAARVLRAARPAHPAGRARGAQRLRGGDAAVRAAAWSGGRSCSRSSRARSTCRTGTSRRDSQIPQPRRPRVDAGPALLVAVGRGAVLPRAGRCSSSSRSGCRCGSAGVDRRVLAACSRSVDRRLVRARRVLTATGPQPRLLLDALAGVGVRRRRPARASSPAVAGQRLAGTRALAAWIGLALIVVAGRARSPTPSCSPARSPLMPVSAPLAVIWAGMPRAALSLARSPGSGPCSGSATSRTRSTSGTGRSSCSRRTSSGQPSQAPGHGAPARASLAVADALQALDRGPVPRRHGPARAAPRCPRRDASRSHPVRAVPPSCCSASAVAGYTVEKQQRAAAGRRPRRRSAGDGAGSDGRAVDRRRQLDDLLDRAGHGASAFDGLGP